MWLTFGIVVGVALCIGIYLAIGAMRTGATFLEVLPTVSLLVFGIALAAGLLMLEGLLFPALTYKVAGVTQYISMGIPSIISIAVCTGIANVWGRMFPKAPDQQQGDSE